VFRQKNASLPILRTNHNVQRHAYENWRNALAPTPNDLKNRVREAGLGELRKLAVGQQLIEPDSRFLKPWYTGGDAATNLRRSNKRYLIQQVVERLRAHHGFTPAQDFFTNIDTPMLNTVYRVLDEVYYRGTFARWANADTIVPVVVVPGLYKNRQDTLAGTYTEDAPPRITSITFYRAAWLHNQLGPNTFPKTHDGRRMDTKLELLIATLAHEMAHVIQDKEHVRDPQNARKRNIYDSAHHRVFRLLNKNINGATDIFTWDHGILNAHP
jgi:hypothetical protein